MKTGHKAAGTLFISYASVDKAQVFPFAEALVRAGIDVWIDREEIEPLGDFPRPCVRVLRDRTRSSRGTRWRNRDRVTASRN